MPYLPRIQRNSDPVFTLKKRERSVLVYTVLYNVTYLSGLICEGVKMEYISREEGRVFSLLKVVGNEN